MKTTKIYILLAVAAVSLIGGVVYMALSLNGQKDCLGGALALIAAANFITCYLNIKKKKGCNNKE